jgi:hypothetical protein
MARMGRDGTRQKRSRSGGNRVVQEPAARIVTGGKGGNGVTSTGVHVMGRVVGERAVPDRHLPGRLVGTGSAYDAVHSSSSRGIESVSKVLTDPFTTPSCFACQPNFRSSDHFQRIAFYAAKGPSPVWSRLVSHLVIPLLNCKSYSRPARPFTRKAAAESSWRFWLAGRISGQMPG